MSMIGDIVDENELICGERQEGYPRARSLASNSVGFAGIMLEYYVRAVPSYTGRTQSRHPTRSVPDRSWALQQFFITHLQPLQLKPRPSPRNHAHCASAPLARAVAVAYSYMRRGGKPWQLLTCSAHILCAALTLQRQQPPLKKSPSTGATCTPIPRSPWTPMCSTQPLQKMPTALLKAGPSPCPMAAPINHSAHQTLPRLPITPNTWPINVCRSEPRALIARTGRGRRKIPTRFC